MEQGVRDYPVAVCALCGKAKFRIAVRAWHSITPYCAKCGKEWRPEWETSTRGPRQDVRGDEAVVSGGHVSSDVVPATEGAASETIRRKVPAGYKKIKEAMENTEADWRGKPISGFRTFKGE